MKTLIAYATKHGTSEKCAKMLKAELNGEVDLVNLEKMSKIDLGGYDQVIIGGSVYAGRMRKPVRAFCLQHLEELKNKRVGLFFCGIADGKDADDELNSIYPPELLKAAVVKEFFGGEATIDQMNFFEKFIMKKVANVTTNLSKIREDKIIDFAKVMNLQNV